MIILSTKKTSCYNLPICKSRHNSREYPEPRWESSNRCLEYDVLNDKYVTILIDEIIPEVKKKYNISDERKLHGISGVSSGAICAFTAAWERTDYFHKVFVIWEAAQISEVVITIHLL